MKDDSFAPLSRRRFLAAGGAWLGATLGVDAAAERRAKTISIFHTTDLHGHIVPTANYDGVGDLGGMARCVTQIRRWKKEFPDSLLVDIGDVYQGTPVGLNTGGKVMIELFNKLGYDAWALGNHDFDWGRGTIEGVLEASKSGIVSGNLRIDGRRSGEATGVWEKVKPWVIKEVGGFRVGLVGIITPGLPYWLSSATLGGVEVLDPVESLRRSIDEMKAEKADAIVVMGHLGFRFQGDDFANPLKKMFQEVEGVDVLLAGHTHQDQPSWMSGRVLCTQASYYGIHCGRVDLTFDKESRKLIDRRAFTVLMDSRFDLDPVVMEIAKPELAKADQQMKRKVCTFINEVPAAAVATLFCEAFAAALLKSGTTVDGVLSRHLRQEADPGGR
ncbi:bifunctional UDP-sugar hydrolase/5'-nucleotidase [Luteolibacter sp. Populi]|uniref:bifunctional metallophosphatase/5'-nucleotidase n=1 Tax=Luteolibacter sp. Populi TaxID=3230487 RepID=UPI003465B53C